MRVWLLRAMAVSIGLFITPCQVLAQGELKVNYGEGQYGAYRRQLSEFATRSADLVAAINGLSLTGEYCTSQAQAEDGAKLAAFRRSLEQLQREYTSFKHGIEQIVDTQGVLRQFVGAGDDPKAPNFWTFADREIIGHPLADLNAKAREFANSKLVDCNPPRTMASPRPPPPPPPPPPVDPLAGLTRPGVPEIPIPPAPKPFCSEAERRAWIKATLQPLMDSIIDASNALRNYGDDVYDRLQNARGARPVSTAAVRALEAEFKWENTAHQTLDELYWRLAAIRDATTVINCGEKRVGMGPGRKGGGGTYVGVNVGLGKGASKWNETPAASSTDEFGLSGFGAGAFAGYQTAKGPVTTGVEGDFALTSISGDTLINCGSPCETSNRWLATARARIGFPVGAPAGGAAMTSAPQATSASAQGGAIASLMPYVTGGMAFGNVRANVGTFPGGSQVRTGWVLGGGLAFPFLSGSSLSARIEFLHFDLGQAAVCNATTCGGIATVAFKANVFRFGVTKRFGQ